MTARIAAVVPVYNGTATIEGCLRALDRQSLPAEEYEVIVVDDGSSDETPSLVEAFAASARASITLVRQDPNAGPAAARNAGVAASTAPIVAFTDADCQASPTWLERGLARLEDPSVTAVEGRTDPAGDVGTLTHQMENESGGLWMTCNMMYRREAIEAAGGFDERFRLAWLEDSDLAFSVQENGGTIAWDPEVIVDHLVLDEGRRKFPREAKKRFYNPLLFRKHPDLYRQHVRTVVPGLPEVHLKYMAVTIAPFVTWAVGLPGASVLLALPWAFYLRRLAHAYRARDLASIAQVSVHPFVQTAWVIAGSVKFKAFSLDL